MLHRLSRGSIDLKLKFDFWDDVTVTLTGSGEETRQVLAQSFTESAVRTEELD